MLNLICCPLLSPKEAERGEVHKISSKFILCDHVPNYCDHPVSQSSDLMEKKFDADYFSGLQG